MIREKTINIEFDESSNTFCFDVSGDVSRNDFDITFDETEKTRNDLAVFLMDVDFESTLGNAYVDHVGTVPFRVVGSFGRSGNPRWKTDKETAIKMASEIMEGINKNMDKIGYAMMDDFDGECREHDED